MEEIERLLAEYKIRFRDTDKITNRDDDRNFMPIIKRNGVVYNENGEIRSVNGAWAIADLKEAPEKWVVEKDESSPIWERFKDKYSNYSNVVFCNSYIHCNKKGLHAIAGGDLLEFKGYQYLTLEQWRQFFGKPEFKVGDFGFFYDYSRDKYVLSTIGEINDHSYPYRVTGVGSFLHFQPIDITKPLDKQIKEFLKDEQ